MSRSTKAALVRSLRGDEGDVDEEALLSDVPYLLQAISAGPVKFPTTPAQAQTVSITSSISSPLLHLLSILVEAGLLYRRISVFASPEHRSDGLVRQSLKASFSEELTGYLNKISVVEGEIRQQTSLAAGSGDPADAHKVTLRRVVLWISDDLLRLRLMSTIIQNIGMNEGGAIINIIYDLSGHGDPFIQAFTQKTLREISAPFYEMLAKWIYEGELVDPHYEFFVRPVAMSSSKANGRPDSGDTSEDSWKTKYVSVKVMIPRWISEKLAQKIFLIGKSLNFIRYSCADADFVINHYKQTSQILTYGDTSALERSIDEAYSLTSKHLRSLMLNKFHLLDHLKALKKYILLNAGDFVSVLMERLGESLEHPASTLHRHNLTSSLGDAIQTSNAQFEPEHVIKHLDARMLEGSRGTVGWEVFTLEYRLEKPIDVIITESNARQYLKIFNFLWRLKRVEFALSSSWRRHMTSERGMLNQVKSVAEDWKTVRGVSDEMIHFVLQLQYYILYEVIEDSWKTLQDEISSETCDLDMIISAHSTYVKAIVDKALLGSQQRSAKDEREEDCLSLLHDILKIMLAYRDQTSQLYSYSLSEYTKIQTGSARRNKYDTTRDDSASPGSPVPVNDNLHAIREKLAKLSKEFKEATCYLLAALSYQRSETMRFLAIRLNYNQFYTIPRLRKDKPVAEKEKLAARNPVAVAV